MYSIPYDTRLTNCNDEKIALLFGKNYDAIHIYIHIITQISLSLFLSRIFALIKRTKLSRRVIRVFKRFRKPIWKKFARSTYLVSVQNRTFVFSKRGNGEKPEHDTTDRDRSKQKTERGVSSPEVEPSTVFTTRRLRTMKFQNIDTERSIQNPLYIIRKAIKKNSYEHSIDTAWSFDVLIFFID